MLNPPLSILSDDLLAFIVEQLAKLPFLDINLKNLSLADRAFTQSCQNYIFRELNLSTNHDLPDIFKQLAKKKKFLDDKPSFANRVRVVKLAIARKGDASVFKDPNFISILQLFAKSPMPPYELHFGGRPFASLMSEDPMLVVRQLSESFFSQTLTILHLKNCVNVPLPLFLICPRLRVVDLDQVGVTDESYDKYPDNQCSDREAPLLEVLTYRNSHTLVKQMITPPPRFNSPVVLWSNLRVLTLAPRDEEGMACLQPILDAACNTLEELHLTKIYMGKSDLPDQQLPIAGLVNFSNLRNLQVFFLDSTFDFKPRRKRRAKRSAPPCNVLDDINIILGTIPGSNKVTNLRLDLTMIDRPPYRGGLDQDWVGMFSEVIRISGGKPLELELAMVVSDDIDTKHPGQDELFTWIMEKAPSLSDHPKICTHWWNPSFWSRGIGPFTRGQVRGRCKR